MNKMGYSFMMYRNVAYKEYLDIQLDQTKECVLDFYEKLSNQNLQKNGPLIISYTQIMKNHRVNILIQMSVNQPFYSNEILQFRSYLCIDHMLQARMPGQDYESEEVKALNEIEAFSKENKLRRISPYYHIINEFDDYHWIDLKVKVLDRKD